MGSKSEVREFKSKVVKEIRDAAARYGVKGGVDRIRQKYPEIPRATWNRYVTAAKATPLDAAIELAIEASNHLPATPPPSVIAKNTAEAERSIDFIKRLDDLYSDAEMLRAYSIETVKVEIPGEDENGNPKFKLVERIKKPTFFAQSIKIRSDLLDNAVRTIQQLYDLQRLQRFYDSILAEITTESPDIAQRITERLVRLDAEMGMTVNCRL